MPLKSTSVLFVEWKLTATAHPGVPFFTLMREIGVSEEWCDVLIKLRNDDVPIKLS